MSRNDDLFIRAQRTIPGGVNSPVRAFRSVGGTPRFIERGQGAYVWDADGKRYIDYVGSWGPMILGHAHPAVVEAVARRRAHGRCRSARRPRSRSRWPRRLLRARAVDRDGAAVSSGTEATMSALRLARGFTGREQDREVRGLLPRPRRQPAGEGRLRGADVRAARSRPAFRRRSANDTHRARRTTISAAIDALFPKHGEDIAAIIVEPVAGNMS